MKGRFRLHPRRKANRLRPRPQIQRAKPGYLLLHQGDRRPPLESISDKQVTIGFFPRQGDEQTPRNRHAGVNHGIRQDPLAESPQGRELGGRSPQCFKNHRQVQHVCSSSPGSSLRRNQLVADRVRRDAQNGKHPRG